MGDSLFAFLIFIGFLGSWYGWGRAFLGLTKVAVPPSLGLTASVGMACWIFLGGILNMLNLALPWILYFMQFIGLAFTVYYFTAQREKTLQPVVRGKSLTAVWAFMPWLILAIIIAYMFFNLLPTMVLNHADDLRGYLVRPLRILQTGSIAGNPFDFLGFDSLGSQAWLQTFFLLWLPVNYIALFDPILCLFLSGVLINDLGRQFKVHAFYRSLAIVSLVMISNHSVNISSLYSGTLMVLGLVYAGYLFFRDKKTNILAVSALFIAALVTLKTVFFFAAFMYSLFFLGLIYLYYRRLFLKAAGVFIALVALFVLPWVVVSAEVLPLLFQMIIEKLSGNTLYDTLRRDPQGYDGIFSTVKMNYGNSMFDFSSLALVIVMACMLLVYRMRIAPKAINYPAHYTLFIFGMTAVAAYVFNINAIHPAVGVRYSLPILIPALALVFFIAMPVSSFSWKSRFVEGLILLAAVAGLALFVQDFASRVGQMRESHHLLSYPAAKKEFYANFNRYALGDEALEKTKKIQFKAPEGATIMVLSTLPHRFDFSRNSILNLHPSMIEARKFPLAESPDVFRAYLHSYGVQYVLWEYIGFDVPNPKDLQRKLNSSRGGRDSDRIQLQLIIALKALAHDSQIVFSEKGVVLFDITASVAEATKR